jgi:hypothetical protein
MGRRIVARHAAAGTTKKHPQARGGVAGCMDSPPGLTLARAVISIVQNDGSLLAAGNKAADGVLDEMNHRMTMRLESAPIPRTWSVAIAFV